ncbi:hypothetical protein BT96DRAFT_1007782 [Gymnopus androsaceus JB14]|uniref:Uncharacterized protein n=1 Tax=Gymnopus androsaceus JB14 TaxID=1447944 RepID=A0A6A4GHG2_9AGAR|nr:hypothetical protein BT96DRAFT_1007782 [Gymnopus androsaceus JB14]
MSTSNLALETDLSDIAQLPVADGAVTESPTTATSPSPNANDADGDPEENDEDVDNSFSVADSDSSDLAFHKTEGKIFLDKPSSLVPDVTEPDTYTLAKMPGFGDNAIRMRDKDRNHVKFRVIAELAQGDKYELNKVGPYLDMLYQSNGEEILNIDNFKRGKAKIVMRPLITPFDTLPEGVAVFEQAVERFDNITAFTTVKRKAYFDSQKPNDVRLYPGLASIKGSEWVVRGRDSWHIAASTSVVFANVPNGKDDVGPQAVMQGNRLLPVDRVEEEIKRRNNEALQVTPANKNDRSLLGNYPDPDGHIRKLAQTYNLSKVRVKTPEVRNGQGTLLHPSEYERYLIPGARVAVLLDHKIWDFTSTQDGRALAHPSRHCVATALEIHIIPDYDEDIRDLIHRHEADKRVEAARVKEEERLVEEHRESAKAEEAARLVAAAERAENEESRKLERAERLKSLWRIGSSSSLPSVDTAPTAGTSTASTPSPSKRGAAEDPPTSPSPPKHRTAQTARGTTGRKPPKKITAPDTPTASSDRSTRSKGKAKAQDPMDVDSGLSAKGKGKLEESMDVDGSTDPLMPFPMRIAKRIRRLTEKTMHFEGVVEGTLFTIEGDICVVPVPVARQVNIPPRTSPEYLYTEYWIFRVNGVLSTARAVVTSRDSTSLSSEEKNFCFVAYYLKPSLLSTMLTPANDALAGLVCSTAVPSGDVLVVKFCYDRSTVLPLDMVLDESNVKLLLKRAFCKDTTCNGHVYA